MAYYHVRISQKSSPSHFENRLDMSFEELENRFLSLYAEGSQILINGRVIPVGDIDRIRISKSDLDSNALRPTVEAERRTSGVIDMVRSIAWYIADKAEDVTEQLITSPPGSAAESALQTPQEFRPSQESREVFVVHGRNIAARNALFDFLRAIELSPLEWGVAVQSTGKASPYIGEILDAAFSRAHAVVVLFTPDDEARLREAFHKVGDPPHETELTGQARPNVLFEAGMAMSRSEDRTVLVEVGQLRPFSDVAGRHLIRLDASTQCRQELAKRLETAGCPINLNGTDWHSAGDFESALVATEEVSSESGALLDGLVPGYEEATMSEDAKHLLVEASKDTGRVDDGVRKETTMGGTFIFTNRMTFGDPKERKSIARWEAAIEELVNLDLLEDPYGEAQYFQVTHKGFQVAESLGE